MQSLKDAIVALRREIESALEQNEPLPEGSRLEADRVVVTLQFSANPAQRPGKNAVNFIVGNNGAANSTQAKPEPVHSVMIEFKYSSRGGALVESAETIPPATTKPSAPMKGKLNDAEANRVKEQLAGVFGAPGFDSAARATVFCEALQDLSEAESKTLLAVLQGRASAENDSAVKRAVALLQRVCRSGPAGVEPGKVILANLFQRHSVSAIVKLVSATWKTQQDWMS